ncbi:hypothetical protein [Agrobacterium larrymoorei]|uniref:DUF2975 domain-containing protein n=1 Tax=Agrobacterium larrymoorei TaxID=160699 RepID=A0AAF0HAZ2_9HYPH|nr:hypothetical protein [Agrobacterium larrymoorei]WHA41079.1 hypothetical protein CFBP5477_000020 [Agrobacterium larrymoorei]
MMTPSVFFRCAYCVEFIVFALPLYLLAAVLAPVGAFAVALTPIALPAYMVTSLIDPETLPGLFGSVAFVLFVVAAYFALWQLGRLSLVYVKNGSKGLKRHRRDLRIGLLVAIIPTGTMAFLAWAFTIASDAFADGGFLFWLGLPPIILAAHLWLATRFAGDNGSLTEE